MHCDTDTTTLREDLARLRGAGLAVVPPGALRLYLEVCRLTDEHGRPPTLRELMKACGIRSHNGVKCHLDPLRARGWVGWADRQGRTLRPLYRCRLFAEGGAA